MKRFAILVPAAIAATLFLVAATLPGCGDSSDTGSTTGPDLATSTVASVAEAPSTTATTQPATSASAVTTQATSAHTSISHPDSTAAPTTGTTKATPASSETSETTDTTEADEDSPLPSVHVRPSVTISPILKPVWKRYEDTHPHFTYTGSWDVYDDNPATFSGGTAHHTSQAAQVTASFQGTRIRLIMGVSYHNGIAEVRIDGQYWKVDTYVPFEDTDGALKSKVVWTSPELAAGTHTFVLRCIKAQNSESYGWSIFFDAVEVLGKLVD